MKKSYRTRCNKIRANGCTLSNRSQDKRVAEEYPNGQRTGVGRRGALIDMEIGWPVGKLRHFGISRLHITSNNLNDVVDFSQFYVPVSAAIGL